MSAVRSYRPCRSSVLAPSIYRNNKPNVRRLLVFGVRSLSRAFSCSAGHNESLYRNGHVFYERASFTDVIFTIRASSAFLIAARSLFTYRTRTYYVRLCNAETNGPRTAFKSDINYSLSGRDNSRVFVVNHGRTHLTRFEVTYSKADTRGHSSPLSRDCRCSEPRVFNPVTGFLRVTPKMERPKVITVLFTRTECPPAVAE